MLNFNEFERKLQAILWGLIESSLIKNYLYFLDALRVGIGDFHLEFLEVELESDFGDASLDLENQAS